MPVIEKDWMVSGGFLRLPLQKDAAPVRLLIRLAEETLFEGEAFLAEERVDNWVCLPIKRRKKEKERLSVMVDKKEGWLDAIEWRTDRVEWDSPERPYFHFYPSGGEIGKIISIREYLGKWSFRYTCFPFDTESAYEVIPPDMEDGMLYRPVKNGREACCFTGDVDRCFRLTNGGTHIIFAKSRSFRREGLPFRSLLSLPVELTAGRSGGPEIKPCRSLLRLRLWKREWEREEPGSRYEQPFSFRVLPSIWPNITIAESEGTDEDISAGAFEIHLELAAAGGEMVCLEVCGYSVLWDSRRGCLKCGPYSLKTEPGRLICRIYVDKGCSEWICGNRILFLLQQKEEAGAADVDNSVSGNLERCQIWREPVPGMRIWTEKGCFQVKRLTVYGLRREGYSPEGERLVRRLSPKPTVFYKCPAFTVYYDRVRDKNYGWPDAAVVSSGIVVSPQRVMEEFVWRKTPWGDMVRVAERREIWYGGEHLSRYPSLNTGISTLDAACRIALNTFALCKSRRFAIPGQKGMWAAGLFQGPKESFGVWIRDSAHAAIRTGNLIDPEGAERTLRYAAGRGFDNGEDGPALGIVGVWDYYLATGNKALFYELWPALKKNIEAAEKKYNTTLGLVRAEHSTSNDAFPEPENGGYCLGTECYYMLAFEAAAHIGRLMGETKKNTGRWQEYGANMRRAIRTLYWNPVYGYFTSGPKGSKAFEKGYWETSGEEGAIWPRMGIADPEQRSSVLEKLDKTAMSEYGIRLFPNRTEKNHFCGTVWGVWQAGFASAASALGRLDLIVRLTSQQIRACLMNKTFYEVIDADTGLAWRWPGQLWHAAGFLSLIYYGFFGIEYTEEGLCFHPAVPESLAGMELEGLPYRKAVLDVKASGWGCRLERLLLDGKEYHHISPLTEGRHSLILVMEHDGK